MQGTEIASFLCGLHELCSHTMVPLDLFIYLFTWISPRDTRVKRPSRGLAREPGYKFVSTTNSAILVVNVCILFHEVVLLIQDNTSGPGLCYRYRLYKSFYDLKRQHLTA